MISFIYNFIIFKRFFIYTIFNRNKNKVFNVFFLMIEILIINFCSRNANVSFDLFIYFSLLQVARLRANVERSSSMNAMSKKAHENNNKKYENPSSSWRPRATDCQSSSSPLTSSILSSANTSTISNMSRSSSILSSISSRQSFRATNKPAFKVATKIQYDDRNLYSNVRNSNVSRRFV